MRTKEFALIVSLCEHRRRELRQQLELPQDPVIVEEHRFAAGVYVIVDLLATSSDDADRAAQALAAIVSEPKRSGDLGLLLKIDAAAGVHQESRDGGWVRVSPLSSLSLQTTIMDRIASLGFRWIVALLGSLLASCCGLVWWLRRSDHIVARGVRWIAALLGSLLVCCYRCALWLWRLRSGSRPKQSEPEGAMLLAQEEPLNDVDDLELRPPPPRIETFNLD